MTINKDTKTPGGTTGWNAYLKSTFLENVVTKSTELLYLFKYRQPAGVKNNSNCDKKALQPQQYHKKKMRTISFLCKETFAGLSL